MSISLKEVVDRLPLEQLRQLLGRQLIELASLVDNKLIESRRIRELVLGEDGGRELLGSKNGWLAVVEVLNNRDAEALCEVLSCPTSRPYVSLQSLDIENLDVGARDSLYNFFGIEYRIENKINVIEPIRVIAPDYQLFDHQRIPASAANKLLCSEPNRCVLHIPTGGGKTRTAMVIICRWLVNNPGTCVVWLAASTELLEQAAAEFEKAWKHLGDRSIKIERIWGPSPFPESNFEDTMVIAGLSKLSNRMMSDRWSLSALILKLSLIVFDEAHQAIAPTYRSLVELLSRSESMPLLGLTATPGRTWKNEIEDEKLAEFFSHRKVAIEIEGYSSAVDYLVKEGYLASANYIDIKYESESPYCTAAGNSDDYSAADLLRIGEDNQRNLELVRAAIALAARHKRILLFAPSVESAHLIAKMLKLVGKVAYSIDGTTNDVVRGMLINKFRGNTEEAVVLCNYGVLTTGFDAPRTSCVIIGRPTKSVVLYSQMVGRALRGCKVGGNMGADVVTVVDTSLKGFGNVSEGFNFWDKKWWS